MQFGLTLPSSKTALLSKSPLLHTFCLFPAFKAASEPFDESFVQLPTTESLAVHLVLLVLCTSDTVSVCVAASCVSRLTMTVYIHIVYLYTPYIWWIPCAKYTVLTYNTVPSRYYPHYTPYIYGSGQPYTFPCHLRYTPNIYGSGQPYTFPCHLHCTPYIHGSGQPYTFPCHLHYTPYIHTSGQPYTFSCHRRPLCTNASPITRWKSCRCIWMQM